MSLSLNASQLNTGHQILKKGMNTLTVLRPPHPHSLHGDPDPGITAKNGIRILRLRTSQFAKKNLVKSSLILWAVGGSEMIFSDPGIRLFRLFRIQIWILFRTPLHELLQDRTLYLKLRRDISFCRMWTKFVLSSIF
jgi:hypothetical protein